MTCMYTYYDMYVHLEAGRKPDAFRKEPYNRARVVAEARVACCKKEGDRRPVHCGKNPTITNMITNMFVRDYMSLFVWLFW